MGDDAKEAQARSTGGASHSANALTGARSRGNQWDIFAADQSPMKGSQDPVIATRLHLSKIPENCKNKFITTAFTRSRGLIHHHHTGPEITKFGGETYPVNRTLLPDKGGHILGSYRSWQRNVGRYALLVEIEL